MAMLKARSRPGLPSRRPAPAPMPAQTIRHGIETAVKTSEIASACGRIGSPGRVKAGIAAAQIIQALGLTHWNSAAPRKPSGGRPGMRPEPSA